MEEVLEYGIKTSQEEYRGESKKTSLGTSSYEGVVLEPRSNISVCPLKAPMKSAVV